MHETERLVAPNKRPGPGRPPTLDPIAVAADLAALNGNISAVAKKHSVTRGAIQGLIRRTESLKDVLEDAREGMIDNGESALYRAVLNGEAWAVCFFLKTQGKSRGYVERQEVEATTKTRLVVEERTVGDDGSTADGTPDV